jgi:hypothetical protein
MPYIKAETAGKRNTTDAEQLKKCCDCYHNGNGKKNQAKYFASLTPEQKAERLAKQLAWKRRNVVRIGLLRWVTNTKFRVAKKNPTVADVPPWDLIGCHVGEFQSHIESMFRDGIGWHNRKEWELDHIRPLCEFDLTDMTQVRECLHFSNVQILIVGPHLEKAKAECREFMEKLAREHWQAHEAGEFPGFTKAWNARTNYCAARRGK